jgi:hypothetical protein
MGRPDHLDFGKTVRQISARCKPVILRDETGYNPRELAIPGFYCGLECAAAAAVPRV